MEVIGRLSSNAAPSREAQLADPASAGWWRLQWDSLQWWAADLEFRPKTIAVKAVRLPETALHILDHWPTWQEMIDGGEEIDAETAEWIEEWRQTGHFVLLWGNDYEIAADGHLVST